MKVTGIDTKNRKRKKIREEGDKSLHCFLLSFRCCTVQAAKY
jgi:hypothetical protein